MPRYNVEFLRANLVVRPGRMEEPAEEIAGVINRWAAQGWELDQIVQIAVTKPAGCLAGLFGIKDSVVEYNCLVFKA